MNIWSPRPDPEAGEEAILPVQPHLAMEVQTFIVDILC